MRLANKIQLCGQRPTVLDPTFGSESGAFDGFIVINPIKMRNLPAAVQQWLYARGCARQFRGPDAAVADCFATARGKRQGWMSAEGAEQVCHYIDKSSPSPFPERCAIVRKCVLLPSEAAVPDNPQPTALFSAENVEKPSMPSAVLERVMTPEEVYKAVAPSVYLVVGSTSLVKLRTGEGVLGSAVAVAPHVAITNCHLVKDQKLLALANEKDEVFIASVLTEDEATDRCFVSVKENLTGITAVRPANELAVGERVYSIGNPSGLKTLGEGIVSGLRHGDVLYVQTTAPISHGSSGGALVDSKGALVGITTMMLKDSQNLNFAIAAEDFWK
jgi:S1-C subfamily serine protease